MAMPDEVSRERLVEKNLRLAYFHAHRACRQVNRALGLEDLEQEAVIGLMAAAGQYDVELHPDVPFSAFARDYILRYINEAIERWSRVELDPLLTEVPDPHFDTARERLQLEVWDMLEHVPRQVRPLLVRRYGLDGGPTLGLIELADKFGLTVRTAGRQLAMAREVIRHECRERGFSFERWAQQIADKIA